MSNLRVNKEPQTGINKIETIYSYGLNKGFSLRLCVDSWIRHKTPEEGQMTYRPKREHNNEDEDKVGWFGFMAYQPL